MLIKDDGKKARTNKLIQMTADLVIAGGGIAGTCAAIMAARNGIQVILVQDRPVLGGNASSEVRLWILGATSHMGNNNRWAREGGIMDEIMVENLYRNKEGNPLILDTILLEKVTGEPGITLLLNTMIYEIEKSSDKSIRSVKAFCSQNSTAYNLRASLFCDASGDGIVSFLAGGPFRMGAESKSEFGEALAPSMGNSELLGHSIYFYSKRVEKAVKFIPPAYALQDIKQIPRYKMLSPQDDGCRLWWIEYGGHKDTVYDSEMIKWELWRVVYGVWHYIKNSGEFDDVDNLTLEWVGTIPGKRESRRFEGRYMLKQQDVVEQTCFEDAVAYGGWALDLHPAEGIYSELPGCIQWHSKGIYQIPYRCFISEHIENLFYAGRIISATHIAFGSSRVMATCGHGGQAVGMAAALCIKQGLLPGELVENPWIGRLQNDLNKQGQSIPGKPISYEDIDLMRQVALTSSSICALREIPFDGPWIKLEVGTGQLLPMKAGVAYRFKVRIKADKKTLLKAELRISSKAFNYTPDILLEAIEVPLEQGEQDVEVSFTKVLSKNQYGFVLFQKAPTLSIQGSLARFSGILSVFNGKNKAVSNNGLQDPPVDSGLETFEFWCPRRRPHGHNIAMVISPALEPYAVTNLKNGFTRPYLGTNAWAAAANDKEPKVTLSWESPQRITCVTLHFDTDFDHPMESTLMGHPEDVVPFCIPAYQIRDETGKLLYEKKKNHQTINRIALDKPTVTSMLQIAFQHPSAQVPAALFEISCE